MSVKISNSARSGKTRFLPVWIALPLALMVWEAIPWAVSLLAPRYGWVEDRPNTWNSFGLIPVLIGTTGLIWGLFSHSAQSSKGIDMRLDKSYLLKVGMHRVSRNPMFLSELMLMFGWVIFYGSIPVLMVLAVWYVFFEFYAVPQEERVLEARFGEEYREYKNRVPRWIGRARH